MITFGINTDGLDATFDISEGVTEAEHLLAKKIKDDTTPFVPYKTGRLTENTTVRENRIVYPGPYARFLYYGKLMVDPETGSPWARKGAKKVLTQKHLVFTKTTHPQAQSHWFEVSSALNLPAWIDFAKEELLQ